ncbi:hypothetical protein [Desmospora activa]|uniref:Uncharacterized protein n=1 Tax=Desmospora activa DSM 45169 TaxID=1121389 RepID=A0A2T4ZD26_9BACL|nr:hypothetical protein [Desmospora activa]PTM59780.1 hypothetical protein C8J48_2411 [Desmospora activa DSM 45169]
MVFDLEGKDIHSRLRLKEHGIFSIREDNQGNYFLPAEYGERVIQIAQDGSVRPIDSLEDPIYLIKEDDVQVVTYNTGYDYGTLEISEGSNVTRLELDGFNRLVSFDEKYVYSFADLIDEEKTVLYIVDRKLDKLVKTLPLKHGVANDMKKIHGKLIITGTDNATELTVVDQKTLEIEYVELPTKNPEYILVDNDRLLITHVASNKITIMDKKRLTVTETVDIQHPVFKVRADHRYIYALTQLESNDHAGVIGVYDKKTWNLKREILLPKIRETLVQDLTLLHSEER